MTSPKKWQEEFEDKILQDFSNCGGRECEYPGKDRCFHGSENQLKSFITQTLSDQATRLREAMEKVSVYDCECGGGSCAQGDGFKHCKEEMLTAFDKALREEV